MTTTTASVSEREAAKDETLGQLTVPIILTIAMVIAAAVVLVVRKGRR